jgi:membrane-bound lytic murein transglycosylase B
MFVACLASAGGGVVAWQQLNDEPPLGAPPPPPPPPQFASAPALPSALPPTLAAPSAAHPTPSANVEPPAPSRAAPSEGSARNPIRPLPAGTRPADALSTWAQKLRRVDIPPVALQAYGYAETVLAKAHPSCHLSWTLLAGIGAVESNHGRYGGAQLQPDGTSEPPIIGVPLAGIGTERVPDTDRGALDGDRKLDRAIGPMQFLPSTWRLWATDGDGDGQANPFDIDDAAVTAGYYLCAGGADLATGDGWSAAVFSYNHVPTYVERVYDFADAYGRAT